MPLPNKQYAVYEIAPCLHMQSQQPSLQYPHRKRHASVPPADHPPSRRCRISASALYRKGGYIPMSILQCICNCTSGTGREAAAFLPVSMFPEHLCLIILCNHNPIAAQLLRRIFAEGFHDALNSRHPLQTLHRHGFHAIAVIAIFFIQLQQRFIQRHALFLIISRHFADQHCRINAILIPCISPCQTAVAFLKSQTDEYEPVPQSP